MAFTRKMLKAMGIEDDKIEMIMEAHTEVTDALKADRDKYKGEAENNKPVDPKATEEYKALKKEYDDYKTANEAKATKAAKEAAVKAYFEGKNITGANLTLAMRGCKDEISDIEIVDGKIKDTKALDELVSGDYAGLVVTTTENGVNTPNPPKNNGGGKVKTKAEILAIKDKTERQQAMLDNPEMFGI